MLESFLSTRDRTAVLEALMAKPSQTISIRGLARAAGKSPALVSNVIRALEKNGIVKKKRVCLEQPLARAIKILLNQKKIMENLIVRETKRIIPGFRGMGVYGSWADGTNHEDSDIDIWVKVRRSPNPKEIIRLRSKIQTALGHEPNIVFLDDAKIARLREKDPVFYHALAQSFLLEGETIA